MKEFLNVDEVLSILNIKSKEYLSAYLKREGIKVYKGKLKPYPKNEILKLAKKRQEQNHFNSKQNQISLYIDDNLLKEPPNKQPKPKENIKENAKETSLYEFEKKLSDKIIAELKDLGVYENLDKELIKVYVKNLILLEYSSKELEKKGLVSYTERGTTILSPELLAFNSLTKNLVLLSKTLGIGAINRINLNPKEIKQTSAFDILLKEAND